MKNRGHGSARVEGDDNAGRIAVAGLLIVLGLLIAGAIALVK